MIGKLRSLVLFASTGCVSVTLAQGDNPQDEAVGPVRPVEVVNEVPVTVKDTVPVAVMDTVPVSVTELPSAGERVQAGIQVRVEPGEEYGCGTFEVPADKELLIDQVSGDIRLPVADEQRAIVTLETRPDAGGSLFTRHYFPLTPVGTNISVGTHAQSYSLNEQPRIFHDASFGPLQVCLWRGPALSPLSAPAGGRVSISGLLTDRG